MNRVAPKKATGSLQIGYPEDSLRRVKGTEYAEQLSMLPSPG
jgi:hypothetical protein